LIVAPLDASPDMAYLSPVLSPQQCGPEGCGQNPYVRDRRESCGLGETHRTGAVLAYELSGLVSPSLPRILFL